MRAAMFHAPNPERRREVQTRASNWPPLPLFLGAVPRKQPFFDLEEEDRQLRSGLQNGMNLADTLQYSVVCAINLVLYLDVSRPRPVTSSHVQQPDEITWTGKRQAPFKPRPRLCVLAARATIPIYYSHRTLFPTPQLANPGTNIKPGLG